jgi:hypothetical protein
VTLHYERQAPEPPGATLLATPDVLAVRLRGRPRSPATGAHRHLVIFAEPTMSARRLAAYLREAAERLEAAETA